VTDTLVCDTSAVLAALDAADPDHDACTGVLAGSSARLLMSPLVLAELDHLVRTRLGTDAARILAEDVAGGAYDLAPLSGPDIAACVAVDRTYADLGIGLADASLVVLAERVPTRTLFTLDERHFRVVRPQQGGAFHLLPADG